MVTQIRETIGRQALIALANQYESVADALMELIDNPFDYRRGRPLTIEVEVEKRSEITVLDVGGEGMDDAALADWINWGTGHEHVQDDIGQYHVGGKLAAIYLANSVEIIARRSGDDVIWRFHDPRWGTRTELLTTEPEQLSLSRIPPRLATLPPRTGFTLVRLTHLKCHRYEVGILVARLGDWYRTLIRSGACTIKVNDEVVEALHMPVSSVYEPLDIPRTKLDTGVSIRGSVWVIDRERFKVGRGVTPKAGIRTLFNGRLITQGEEFGHYLAGRGPLQRLFGEIEINNLRPNTTKDGWDRSSPGWLAVQEEMHRQLQPIVAFLNQLSESRAVSRDQRKRANRIAREVHQVIKDLAASDGALRSPIETGATSPDGRRAPSPSPDPPNERPSRGTHESPVPRTLAPEDAIGRTLRKASGRFPAIDFERLGEPDRSQVRQNPYALVVNTDYPLYRQIGETDEYLVETIVLGLLQEHLGDISSARLVAEVNRVIWAWSRTRES
jgi:hypothetical protein